VALSDAQIVALLQDPDVPRGVVLNEPRSYALEVRSLVAFVAARHPGCEDVETDLDAWVRRAGGRRMTITDPYRAIANVGRSLIGRRSRRPEDLYEIPASAVDVSGAR
jgi:hypothetical protein